MDLSNVRRMQGESQKAHWQRVAADAVTMLSRSFVAGEHAVMKPTNMVNNIASDLMALNAQSRAIVIYSDLKSFLLSVIKKGEGGRAFARHMFNIFSLDHPFLIGLDKRQAMVFTDLKIAALVWMAQLDYLRRLCLAFPDRVRSIHCDDFLAQPKESLRAASTHFQNPFQEGVLEDVVSGPIFQRNAKFVDDAYNADQRAQESAELDTLYKEAIAETMAFAARFNRDRPVPDRLPSPLLSPDSA
ncbi:hypothetical protein JCM17845_04730 [Iodidimonas gelatinilytica]|uniref:Sulfotransferase n=1 Tax=Iodidimonas gelatinilytica TaxID=1236966 RepID=A0A5A7MXX5_9PROT|nr:hypothetical protein [Iodidimonas gelatinilytica]GEQ99849.1 hypothetical protein JCM17845_04730 [Iodidimonas gelatinilytica]